MPTVTTLNKVESAAYRRFIDLGILAKVSNGEYDFMNNPEVIVACGDAHRVHDLIEKHANAGARQSPAHGDHILTLNGGGYLLGLVSLVARILRQHILFAVSAKQMNHVVLYAHAPCGKADADGANPKDLLYSLSAGKRRLQRHWHKDNRLAPI